MAAVAATTLTLTAACDSAKTTPAAAPAAALSPGQATYERSCARCHGDRLQGDGATPALDYVRLSGLGDQRLRLTIASGKGEMPAFNGLTPAEVDALVAYMYEVAGA